MIHEDSAVCVDPLLLSVDLERDGQDVRDRARVAKMKHPTRRRFFSRVSRESIVRHRHASSHIGGQRDRAIIALLTYTFSRVGAAVRMSVENVYIEARRTWVRLHEKNSKHHEMPCHHKLETFLQEYIEAAGIADDPKGWLLRTTEGQSGYLTDRPMNQADVYRMIRRRADDAGIKTKIGCHTFRATGVTEYLRNGGKLEIAQQMANHESARTTGLYDHRDDQLTLDEVERILI